MMYCQKCGTAAKPGWKFCEKCGVPLEQAPAAQPPAPMPAMSSDAGTPAASPAKPKQPMSKKNKIIAGAAGGIAAVLAAAFLILRLTYGPSTTDELAEQLNAAVDAKDPALLADYLDDSQSPLLAEDRLKAFKATLESEDVRSTYKEGILEAIRLTEIAAEETPIGDSFSDKLRQELDGADAERPDAWMTFVEKRSWRGSKWSVHIAPVSVAAQSSDPSDDVKSSMQVGGVSAESGIVENLWPSAYAYKGALTGPYGSQSYDGQVDAFGYVEPNTVVFDASQMNRISLEFPAIETAVTLNGKEAAGTPDEYKTFRPVPQKIELAASANAYGIDLSGKAKIDISQDPDYEVAAMLQQAASEQVADLAYATMESWVKATNAGSKAQLTGYDPNGGFADFLTWDMDNRPDSRYALNKIAVNPSSIRFYEDHLTADIRYVYVDSENPELEEDAAIRLEIARRNGKSEWWITDYQTAYVPEADSNVERTNPAFEKERTALSESSAEEAEGSLEAEISASGSVAFTQEDAQSFMLGYHDASVAAINARDFSYVEWYMDPAGPAAKESSDYIGYLETKGITESFQDAVVTDFKNNGDSTYTVSTRESFIIYNKDMEGTARSYDSVYTLSVIDGALKAYKLISTDEVE